MVLGECIWGSRLMSVCVRCFFPIGALGQTVELQVRI